MLCFRRPRRLQPSLTNVIVILLLFIPHMLRAQGDWTQVTAPTTQDLWGVCYGGNQFVAVGTGGTILTSPDGVIWTTRTSGTTEWLLAVARSDTLYVIVGDYGTILTSPDAVTWTPRSSGTTARLNGVAFGGGRFLAVGENGAAVISSDGLNWQLSNTGVTAFLRGVVYGRDRFVMGGGGGTLLSTADGLHFARLGIKTYGAIEALGWDGSTYLAVGEFSTIAWSTDLKNWDFGNSIGSYLRGISSIAGHNIVVGTPVGSIPLWVLNAYSGYENHNFGAPAVQLNAVAASSSTVIAVGLTGTISRWALPAVKPDMVQITDLTNQVYIDIYGGIYSNPYVGQNVTLAATGTAPTATTLLYQWFHDGSPIAGATTAKLALRNLRMSDAGEYAVTVSNSFGTTSSSANGQAFTLRAQPFPLSFGSRDLSFTSPVTVSPWAIAVQPDGGIIVAAPMFFYPKGVPQYGLARLHPDGSLDETFQLPAGALGFNSWVSSLEILPDGRIGVTGSITRTDGSFYSPLFNSDGSLSQNQYDPTTPKPWIIPLSDGRTIAVAIQHNVVTLSRHGSEGAADTSYGTVSFTLGPFSVFPEYLNFSSFVYSSDEAGGFLVATSSFAPAPPGGQYQAKLFRLLSDGSLDPNFPLATVNDVITKIVPTGGRIYYESKRMDPGWDGDHRYKVGRLNADGSVDQTYRLIEFSSGATSNWPAVDLSPDGSVVAGLFDGLARFSGIETDYDTRLINLSIRTTAGSGDQTLIAGFVVAGSSGTRSVLVRGVGPGLVPLGVKASDVVADPQLELFKGSSTIASNDNWDSSLAPTANSLGAYPLAVGSKDSALLSTLAPGAYTTHVTSTSGATGIALIELYDADSAPVSASSARLVNVSGRAHVGTGDNVLIAGFVLSGNSTKRLLIRAIGPGLKAQGVTDFLADPELLIYHGSEVIVTNDNWNYADANTFATVGAFALDPASKDAALVLDLSPGVYTAMVRGVGGTTGSALVEIYEVP